MSKKLNSTAIANELKGKSGFFQKPLKQDQQSVYPSISDTLSDDTVIPRHRDTTIPGNHDTVIPHTQKMVEHVRKSVKEIGKEAATHRFTVAEKKALNEMIFRYKQDNISTSENEITRIAINYLIEDHRQNGDKSFLAQVIKEINS